MSRERESRRLALQSTAELWRGLDILDAELKAGRFQTARETVAMLRGVVQVADSVLVDHLRNTPTQSRQTPRPRGESLMAERPLCLKVEHMPSHGPDDETCSICGREIGRFTPADEPDLEIPTVDTPKPYILWINYHTEGWKPHDCDSLEDCYRTVISMCASDFLITGPPINVGFVDLSAVIDERKG